MQLTNLRQCATRRVLDAWHVSRAPQDFSRLAMTQIRMLSCGGELPVGLGGAGIDTTRVFAYA
eukprot:NODE_23160_length_678_cov_2.252269.p6 GENE.NODE_23160_length_678_cov_2.252269~~NODE_23160_length_678_cov_2.252269.p6  ORF type:complete len:63 (+),score=14.44 NODE_23160_length_678_cov_2.252269:173-361(+)